MATSISKAITMTQLCRKLVRVDAKWSLHKRVAFLRQFFRYLWDRVLVCSSSGKASSSYRRRYSRLHRSSSSFSSCPSARLASESGFFSSGGGEPMASGGTSTSCYDYDTDSDLVSLKISILGDCEIGKTSFVIKSVGNDQEKRCLQMQGLNLVDKIFRVRGARIAFSIWDVEGDHSALNHVPIACKDAVAIIIMFDLTSRSTLNSVLGWYQHARKWNQNAIPILIGTKFDEFVHLPLAVQWTVVSQARTYAKAMNATLFFSSSKHNINVNKVFKFITAKLFNLPWTVERNLNVGEPIIDF